MSVQDDVGNLALVRENEKLRKIVKALIDRVERSTDAQGNAFSLFQAAITLENTVRQRTAELLAVNRQLTREIEERRAVERALEAAKSDAERANLGKTEFLAAASHDLLQPLNVARLFLDAAGERPLDDDVARMIERVNQSLAAAEHLLATLLEMSRLDAGALEPEFADVAIERLFQRLAAEYGFAAEERELRLRFVPCNAVVRTDVRLLERVLRNLLSNALRYTERGGIVLGARRRAGRLLVEVWDTGCGIPAGKLDDIFKEFHRLNIGAGDGPSGMGLGLAIVQRIVRLLHASVTVRSREGRGSVFTIDLPLATADGVTASAPPAGTRDVLRGKTVLVVDDDSNSLEALQALLAGWGLRAVAAHSTQTAVAVADERGGAPAAIVADYHLGESTGVDAIDAVRASLARSIPAIVITADASDATRRAVVARGFGYLNKPLRAERLRSLLSDLLPA